jgi:hypothetical protein
MKSKEREREEELLLVKSLPVNWRSPDADGVYGNISAPIFGNTALFPPISNVLSFSVTLPPFRKKTHRKRLNTHETQKRYESNKRQQALSKRLYRPISAKDHENGVC